MTGWHKTKSFSLCLQVNISHSSNTLLCHSGCAIQDRHRSAIQDRHRIGNILHQFQHPADDFFTPLAHSGAQRGKTMTLPRKQLISLEETPYYHIVSRCVRRAFLCGRDSLTDRSYEHRRKWIRNRIKYLADIFTIDICAYAVMHNHYHLVLKVNSTAHWNNKQVLAYWGALCSLPRYCQ